MRSFTAIFATILAWALIPYTLAALPLSYGDFKYDGDEYFLPPNQVASTKPAYTTGPFQFYSKFNDNGATIKTIQSCKENGKPIISGMKFSWTDGTSKTIGSFTCVENPSGGYHRILQFDVSRGEKILKLLQHGKEGKLCRLFIRTNLGQEVDFGSNSCDGSNKITADVQSGILAGAFGYADGRIHQLGLLMLQNISSVTQETSKLFDYPNTPIQTVTGGATLDASNSKNGQTGKLTYRQETGYNSQYSASATNNLLFGVDEKLTLKFAETTPAGSDEIGLEINTKFEYSMSTTTSSSYSVTQSSTKEIALDICCGPGVSCTWTTYQGQGNIVATDPAQSELATHVTFKTGSSVTYKSSTSWSGRSSDSHVYLVLQTNPPPKNGTQTFDVANYCNAGVGRRLSASKVTANEYKFKAVYNVPKATKLSKIVERMGKRGVTRENLVFNNPFLSKVGMNGIVPRGKKLKYTFKDVAFVQALAVKP